jgi:hypothetical protein
MVGMEWEAKCFVAPTIRDPILPLCPHSVGNKARSIDLKLSRCVDTWHLAMVVTRKKSLEMLHHVNWKTTFVGHSIPCGDASNIPEDYLLKGTAGGNLKCCD